MHWIAQNASCEPVGTSCKCEVRKVNEADRYQCHRTPSNTKRIPNPSGPPRRHLGGPLYNSNCYNFSGCARVFGGYAWCYHGQLYQELSGSRPSSGYDQGLHTASLINYATMCEALPREDSLGQGQSGKYCARYWTVLPTSHVCTSCGRSNAMVQQKHSWISRVVVILVNITARYNKGTRENSNKP